MYDHDRTTHDLRGHHGLSPSVGARAADDARLALWARWEQLNFALYRLHRCSDEQSPIDAILQHERLWQELRDIETDLGVESPSTPPFFQDHPHIW
jgi:hypothetical protein